MNTPEPPVSPAPDPEPAGEGPCAECPASYPLLGFLGPCHDCIDNPGR